MMYNCVIIDDEQPARTLLEKYCKKIDKLQVKGSYKSALEALTVLKDGNIDILFLDIQMPDISGIDFLKILNLGKTKVIFTTAYRDYALESFDLDVVDYLLKPIEFSRFLRAVEKIININSKEIVSIVNSIGKTLILKSGKKQYKILIKDIFYIKSENEYVMYATKSHGNLLVHGALKDCLQSLKGNDSFLKIHRSYIINMNEITYVEGSRVCINEEYFPISETYRLEFFKKWT